MSTHDVTRTVQPDGDTAVVQLVRTYTGDVDDVWDALTNLERLPRWFAPVRGDLRVGGRYEIEGNTTGAVTACDPPRSFTITWENSGDSSDVVVEVTADGPDRTTVRLAHTVPTAVEHWRTYGPAATGIGWDLSVHELGLHLAAPDHADSFAEGAAWAEGPDGAAFMRAAGEDWYAADVAAGTPADDARHRVDTTVGFYTGTAG